MAHGSDDWYTNFSMPQRVHIRSKWLRIPELIIGVLLASAFILYNYMYMLGFVTVVDMTPHAYFGTQERNPNNGSSRGWFLYHTAKKWHEEPKDYKYCSQAPENNGYVNETDGVLPCNKGLGKLAKDSGSSAIIATCIFFEDSDTIVYYPGAEHRVVAKMLARVVDLDNTVAMDLYSTPGSWQFVGEKLPRRFRNGFSGDVNDRSSAGAVSGTVSDKFCDSFDDGFNGPGSMCDRNAWGVYFTLDVLLKAANTDLDHQCQLRNIPYRSLGMDMDVHVHFTNMENFWVLPIGFKPKYTVNVEKTDFAEKGYAPETYWMQDLEVNGTRHPVNIRGVKINMIVTHLVGKFVFFDAFMKLTLASVVLGFTKTIVSLVFIYIYKKCGVFDLTHVALLHDISLNEVSKNDHEVKDLLLHHEAGALVDRTKLFKNRIDTESA